MTATPLPPRIVEVTSALTDAQRDLETLLDGIPSAHHDAPVAEGWTIAQVIEHLALVEDGSGRVVSRLCKAAEGTEEADTDPVLPTLAHLGVETPETPLSAPDMVRPAEGVSAQDALAMGAPRATSVSMNASTSAWLEVSRYRVRSARVAGDGRAPAAGATGAAGGAERGAAQAAATSGTRARHARSGPCGRRGMTIGMAIRRWRVRARWTRSASCAGAGGAPGTAPTGSRSAPPAAGAGA